MKKVVFFPFHHDLELLLKNKDRLVDIEIVGVVSYKEDHLLLETIYSKFGMALKSYDQTLDECDAVILLDNYRNFSTDKYYSVIDDAKRKGKEIVITPLAASQLDLTEYEGEYKLLRKEPEGAYAIDEIYRENYQYLLKGRMYDLSCPVIGIIGQGKNCGKSECQIFVDDVLHCNCRTTVLSANSFGALFGYYTMPDFMYAPIPFVEKVFKFNMYVRQIEKQENSKMIIISIPEGIVPFDEGEFNSFAEHALVITSAIAVDVAILSMYYAQDEIIDSGMEEIIRFCEERFRVPVGAVYISNVMYEILENKSFCPIAFEFLNDEYAAKHRANLEQSRLPVFDLHNRSHAVRVIQDMVEPLSENVKAI